MAVDIESLIRPHLADIETYDPVEPPESLAVKAGIPEDQVIKLNGNENPYGASPKVSKALAALPLHIYPDPFQRRIREALARYLELDSDQIIVGAGGDELIDLLFRLFISPGDAIIDSEPTFGMYGFYARVAGAEVRSVPRDQAFDIDVPGVVAVAGSSRAKLLFVASPNNPTGNVASEEQVKALLDTGLIVVVDEAYYEFSGNTMAGLVQEHENLVVLRTLSKWAGLAGVRAGYGIMSPKLVSHLIDIKSPYNVSTAAEAALLASLQDVETLLENVSAIIDERERMFSMLDGIAGVKPRPSGGNFILCGFEPGRALAVFEGLAGRGIFVRNFRSPRLRDYFRISVGTREQTDRVVGAIAELV